MTLVVHRKQVWQPPAGRRIAKKWESVVAFAASGTSSVDVVTGDVSTTTGTIDQRTTPRGITTFASSASSTRRTWAKKAFTSYNDGYAILCIANPTNAAGAVERAVVIGDEAASAYTASQLLFNSDANVVLSGGRVTLIEYSGGFKATASTDTGVVNGTGQVFIANRIAGTVPPALYANGVNRAVSSVGATGVAATSGIHIHGAPVSTTTGYTSGGIALTVIFNRALTLGEIAELSLNPWQIFEPRQIVVPSSAPATNGPVIFQRPRRQQPRVFVPANNANPLTRGLIALHTASMGTVDASGFGRSLVRSNAPTIVTSSEGLGYKGAATSYFQTADISSLITASQEITLLMLLSGGTTADQGILTASSGDLDHYPYSGNIYSSAFSATRWVFGVAPRVDLTKPHVTTIRYKSTFSSYCQNGLVVSETNAGAAPVLYNNGIWIGSSKITGSTWFYSGSIPLVAIWNRYLSNHEIQLLSTPASVWQLFAPRHIIAPFSSGAAALYPTLSALSAINVTASSAQPRITYTF